MSGTAKKTPGRPRLGKQPMTDAERKRRSTTARKGEGGSTLSLTLSAPETKALKSGMKKQGATVKRDYVAALIVKNG